jgi:hypothetical protein
MAGLSVKDKRNDDSNLNSSMKKSKAKRTADQHRRLAEAAADKTHSAVDRALRRPRALDCWPVWPRRARRHGA